MIKARKHRKTGQVIIEYLLIFGVVLIALIASDFIGKISKIGDQLYNRAAGAMQ